MSKPESVAITIPAGLIPAADGTIAAVMVVDEQGQTGYLVGKDAYARQSSAMLKSAIQGRHHSGCLVSEADMLAGAIAASCLVFDEKETVGFAPLVINLMSGRSIIEKPETVALFPSNPAEPPALGGLELHELTMLLDEHDDAYESKCDQGIPFSVLKTLYAWDNSTDSPVVVYVRDKQYLIRN
ncbi:hypothetical protein D3C78_111620 [compost metagenome]